MNNSIGVIGTGVMGRSIARLCAQNGYPVLLIARNQGSAIKAKFNIGKEIDRKIAKGTMTKDVAERIFISNNLKDLYCTKTIIEAVTENYATKRSLYFSLESVIPEDTIIASNTSSLSITKLAEGMMHPERLIGLHFFNPAEIMKLVEVKLGKQTSTNTFEKMLYFVKRLDKESHHFPDVQGVCVNRILFPMLVEAILLVEENKMKPAIIDRAMKLGTNMPLGPLELCDLIGNDVVYNICEQLFAETKDPKYAPPMLLRAKVLEHELGRKTEIGFYEYKRK